MKRGYVYVLSNPSMPGVFKIGRSVNGGLARAAAIYTTGVPEPFHIEFEIIVDEPARIESAVHEQLIRYRVSHQREFFKCEINEIVATIISEVIGEFEMSVCSGDERHIIDCVLMEASKTSHHFMDVLYALKHLTPSDIDMLVKRSKSNLKVVK